MHYRRAERLAESFYRIWGYRTLARNYRTVGSEIDLIVGLGNQTICFVEVKLRQRAPDLPGLIPRQKKKALQNGALHFVTKANPEYESLRFDLFLIVGDLNTGNFAVSVTRNFLSSEQIAT